MQVHEVLDQLDIEARLEGPVECVKGLGGRELGRFGPALCAGLVDSDKLTLDQVGQESDITLLELLSGLEGFIEIGEHRLEFEALEVTFELVEDRGWDVFLFSHRLPPWGRRVR